MLVLIITIILLILFFFIGWVNWVRSLDKYTPSTYPKYKVGDTIMCYYNKYETIIKVEYDIRYKEYRYITDDVTTFGDNRVYYDNNSITLIKRKINKIIRRNK